MSNFLSKQTLPSAVAVICGLILIRSASIHLQNSYAFLSSIYSYDLVGPGTGVFVATILPAFQLVLGLMLVFFQDCRRFALIGTAVLFAVFSSVQVIALARGLNISCGCFGSNLDNPITWRSILFSMMLFLIASVTAFTYRPDHRHRAVEVELKPTGP